MKKSFEKDSTQVLHFLQQFAFSCVPLSTCTIQRPFICQAFKGARITHRARVENKKMRTFIFAFNNKLYNATPALARADLGVDKRGKASYNKRTPYIQWKSDALSWVSNKKTAIGDMNSGADERYYYFYEAVDSYDEGKANDYRIVAKIPNTNQQLIEEWEEEVRKNNERNHIEGSDSILYESIDEYASAVSQYQSHNANVLGQYTQNDRISGMDKSQSQHNGERNTEESSRNQRGVKSSSRALLDVNFAEKANKQSDTQEKTAEKSMGKVADARYSVDLTFAEKVDAVLEGKMLIHHICRFELTIQNSFGGWA